MVGGGGWGDKMFRTAAAGSSAAFHTEIKEKHEERRVYKKKVLSHHVLGHRALCEEAK